jgi:hypothetical protein
MRHAILGLLLAGCAPVATARTSADEDVRPREADAAARLANKRCKLGWAWAFPGVGQICANEPTEGAVLASLGGAQAAAAVTALAIDEKATQGITAVTLQDLWVYSVTKVTLDEQLAHQALYVPEDTLGELALAPFNGKVIGRPELWAGVPLAIAAGLAVGAIIDGPGHRDYRFFRESPRLFGQPVAAGAAYPLAAATYAFEMEQVAIAEEALFRGYFQSELARACGQACGWATGAALFGGTHAFNALFIDDEGQKKRYLAVGVPYLILIGQYLGGIYWGEGYTLTGSVAAHFWYNVALSMIGYAADPRGSPVSGSIRVPFF